MHGGTRKLSAETAAKQLTELETHTDLVCCSVAGAICDWDYEL